MFNKTRKQTGAPAVTFRHFSRGRWCVFASLHRVVRIGVLAVGMLSSVNIEKVEARNMVREADEPEADERELAEVTVAGTLAPLTQLQSARIVGVITRQDIEQAAAGTVNDLLKLAVGVDVRQRGGFGIQTDISINGGTFDQITILLNGLDISNPQTGHLAADFPVSLSDIERIEVLEGAASRVYGASAFGGAINIVTKEQTAQAPFSGETTVQAGSNGSVGADARIAASPLGSSLSGSFQRSDGATLNSSFKKGNAFWQGQWNLAQVKLYGQAGWSGKSYGANTFYSGAYPNQYESNSRLIGHVGASGTTQAGKVSCQLKADGYWQRMTDHFELIHRSPTGENFHLTDVYGGRVGANIAWPLGKTALAAEVRREGIYSTNLGRPMDPTDYRSIRGEDGHTYTNHDARTNVALSAEHNVLLNRWTVSCGVLANMNTCLDRTFRLYPGIDIAFRPAAGWKLFASYNKGFRLPTFTDLYYKAPTHMGNTGLKPEVSHSFQVGATGQARLGEASWQMTGKLFYHHGTDMIDWVMYEAADNYHSANFDLNNMGFQLSSEMRYSAFSFHGSYAFIHQNRKDAVPIFKSNYAMEYLRHKVVARLTHPIVSRLSAAWSFRWQDRMGSYILYEDAQNTGVLKSYKPYATLDLKLRWTAPHYELWAEGTNLTNHTYYDLGNIPQPGLMVMGGAKVRF